MKVCYLFSIVFENVDKSDPSDGNVQIVEDYVNDNSEKFTQPQLNASLDHHYSASKSEIDQSVEWLTEDKKLSQIMENHFEIPDADIQNMEIFKAPTTPSVNVILARELSFSVRLFGGYDWGEYVIEKQVAKEEPVHARSLSNQISDSIIQSIQQPIILVDNSVEVSVQHFDTKEKKISVFESHEGKEKESDADAVYHMKPRKGGVRRTDQMIDVGILGLNMRLDTFDASELVLKLNLIYLIY